VVGAPGVVVGERPLLTSPGARVVAGAGLRLLVTLAPPARVGVDRRSLAAPELAWRVAGLRPAGLALRAAGLALGALGLRAAGLALGAADLALGALGLRAAGLALAAFRGPLDTRLVVFAARLRVGAEGRL